MLAIIPARGGSKRLPRKNVKSFLSKPLIAWTIEVVKEAGIFDRITLSTDDKEIAKVGQKWGAEVPFMRPVELASDTSPVIDAVKYTIDRLKKDDGYSSDWFFLLEPSSPGRQVKHLREVAEIIKKEGKNFDAVVGVSKISANQTPLKALQIFPDQELKLHDGTSINKLIHRTQDIPDFYFINSSIYAFKTSNLSDPTPSLWGEKVRAYVMEDKYAMDIDTAEDWVIARAKMKNLHVAEN